MKNKMNTKKIKLLSKSQLKIIEEIVRNPGINLTKIITKTRLSPNYVSGFVNSLVERGVLKEEKLKKKRVYLRRFFFNFESYFAKNIFVISKEDQKEDFFDKYPSFRPIFEQIIKNVSGINFILIYGSYARFSATKESDIDILIVGDIKDKHKIKEIFVTLDIEPSIKIESIKDFRIRKADALHQQILKDNIIVYDNGKFIDEL